VVFWFSVSFSIYFLVLCMNVFDVLLGNGNGHGYHKYKQEKKSENGEVEVKVRVKDDRKGILPC